MDIFESLENLNVSEECFEDIVGIVEEYIHEILVGDHQEKGLGYGYNNGGGEYTTTRDLRDELKKHYAPILRGQAKHAIKANRGREKEAKQIHGDIEQQEAKTKKAGDAYFAQADKRHQAFQNWLQADSTMPDTNATKALRAEYEKQKDKAVKLDKKGSKEADKQLALYKKRGKLLSQASDDEGKRGRAERLGFGPRLRKGEYSSDQNVHSLAWDGKKRKY